MAHLSRREMLGASAGVLATAGAGASGGLFDRKPAAVPVEELRKVGGYSRTRILRIFMGSRPAWPRPDLDLAAEMKRQQTEIDKIRGIEDVEFVGNALVQDDATLTRLLEQHKDVDGILAVQLCMGTGGFMHKMADCGIPTMCFAVPYSGHEWLVIPELQRRGKRIDQIASSDFNDVARAIRPIRAIHRMKETKILCISGGKKAPEEITAAAKEQFGIEIRITDPKQLVDIYDAVKSEAAEADAQRWIRNAQAVKEPSREEIVKSARMCIALQKLLAEEKAQAVTINCLGLFAQKVMPAYPCFGFARLNDLGLTGVCEADLPSTLTQVMFLHLTGKPGFVTDPMFDESRGSLIHAHCVAGTKMDGPTSPAAPYVIRSHLEDHKGAVLQTKMRVGQEITMAKLVSGKLKDQPPVVTASPGESLGTQIMLISTGTIISVPDSDSACRTKIEVKVRDARKMYEGWSYGLHRVIFYGNHMDDMRRLARFKGFNLVEEG